jgi:hypothetical protein
VDYHLYIHPFGGHFLDELDHQFHSNARRIMVQVSAEELK